MNTIETLDAISVKHDGLSDRKIGKLMGLSSGRISLYRNGHKTLTEDHRLIAAKLLDDDPVVQLVHGRLERASSPESRHAWQVMMERLTAAALGILLTFSSFMYSPELSAGTEHNADQDIHYAQLGECTRR
jgi:transcriptional regulator with XRE-family HTH domain